MRAHTLMGDPGVIFIDTMNNYHLLSEYDEVKFTATNPVENNNLWLMAVAKSRFSKPKCICSATHLRKCLL